MAPKKENTNAETAALNTSASDMQTLISKWRTNAVNFHGQAGYFVKKSDLDDAQAETLKHIREPFHSKEWEDVSNELDKLRAESVSANKLIDELRTEAKGRQKAVDDYRIAMETYTKNFLVKKSDIKKEREELLEQLKAAKEAKDLAVGELEAAKRGANIDDLPDIVRKNEKISKDLKILQDNLERINGQKSALEVENQDNKKTLLSMQKELSSVRVTLQKTEKMRSDAFGMFEESKIDVPLPQIKSRLVSKLLGSKGLTWLRQAETVMRNDYKDRALKLMSAARSSRDENIKSIGDLLEIVFQWMKKQAWQARTKLAEWIMLLESDLRQGTVRKMTFYRDELKKALLAYKLEMAALNTSQDGLTEEELEELKSIEPTFFENVWCYVQVFRNRASRFVFGNKKAPVPVPALPVRIFRSVRAFSLKTLSVFGLYRPSLPTRRKRGPPPRKEGEVIEEMFVHPGAG